MCVVHRIIKDSETGLQAAIRFESQPKKGITPSTQALLNGQPLVLEANNYTTLTLTEKPAAPKRRESFTERARHMENGRLTGAGIKTRPPEDHELSPQSSCERESIGYPGDDNLARYGTRHKCSKYNRGRKPEYKDRRVRASGSGKARLEASAYHLL